jgi:hypothetical protein
MILLNPRHVVRIIYFGKSESKREDRELEERRSGVRR